MIFLIAISLLWPTQQMKNEGLNFERDSQGRIILLQPAEVKNFQIRGNRVKVRQLIEVALKSQQLDKAASVKQDGSSLNLKFRITLARKEQLQNAKQAIEKVLFDIVNQSDSQEYEIEFFANGTADRIFSTKSTFSASLRKTKGAGAKNETDSVKTP